MSKPIKKSTDALLNAIQDVALVQTEHSIRESEEHCLLQGNYVEASDGICSIVSNTELDLFCRPHTHKLLRALERCKDTVELSQTEQKLIVRSGDFRAQIPCLPPYLLKRPEPGDSNALNPAFLGALVRLKDIPVPNDPQTAKATILVRSCGSAVAWDGRVIAESWHSTNLPRDFILPVKFVKLAEQMSKRRNQPNRYGYGKNSFTIYFEDNSAISTLELAGTWPTHYKLLEVQLNPFKSLPMKDVLQKALELAEVSGDPYVRFENNLLTSDNCTLIVKLPLETKFSLEVKSLSKIANYADIGDPTILGKGLYFQNDNVRGAISYINL